jgi:hypothetical protein
MKPIETDRTMIPVRGDAPGEIFWRGKQWAVTVHGLECLDGTYFVEKGRLDEDLGAHSWLDQLAEKTWVDIDDFVTAWMVAVLYHGYGKTVDPATLKTAVEKMWDTRGAA